MKAMLLPALLAVATLTLAVGMSISLQPQMEQLLSTLRNAVLGDSRLPPEMVRRAFRAIRSGGGRGKEEAAGLTLREGEILVSFARSMSYAQTAKARAVRPVTVRNAIYGIQQKLRIDTMQELVLWCGSNGLVDNCTDAGF